MKALFLITVALLSVLISQSQCKQQTRTGYFLISPGVIVGTNTHGTLYGTSIDLGYAPENSKIVVGVKGVMTSQTYTGTLTRKDSTTRTYDKQVTNGYIGTALYYSAGAYDNESRKWLLGVGLGIYSDEHDAIVAGRFSAAYLLRLNSSGNSSVYFRPEISSYVSERFVRPEFSASMFIMF